MPTTIPTTTSFTRPGSPSAGDAYFETDTKNYIIYDGTAWRGYNYDDTTAFTNRYKLNFDGSGDYANTGYISGSSTGFSHSLWWNTTNTASSMTPFSNTGTGNVASWLRPSNGNFYIIFKNGGTTHNFYPQTPDSNAYSTTNSTGYNRDLCDGNWHHIVITFSGTTVKVYTDGTEWISDTLNASYAGGGSQYVIGRNGNSAGYYMNGSVDEISTFEYELTSTQVSDIYNSGTPVHVGSFGLNLSPSGYWRGGDNDNGTGSTVTDLGSGGNNATLSGNAVIANIGTGESIYV